MRFDPISIYRAMISSGTPARQIPPSSRILVSMTTVGQPRIALCCADPVIRRYLESALHEPTFVLVEWPATSDEAVDVVCTDVADRVLELEQVQASRDVPAVGVIEITPANTPEDLDNQSTVLTGLKLPANVEPATFRLACRLLTDNVRLRRQLQQASRAHQHLARQAMIDPLTELPNRRAWDDELSRRFSRLTSAAAGQASLTLAIFDLDFFKQINDEQGHAAGDKALQTIAQCLRAAVREDDFVARLGGDEFGVLLSGVDRATSERIVERVRARLDWPAAHPAAPAITASAGVATSNQAHFRTAVELSQAADQALLSAKRSGRRRTFVADDALTIPGPRASERGTARS